MVLIDIMWSYIIYPLNSDPDFANLVWLAYMTFNPGVGHSSPWKGRNNMCRDFYSTRTWLQTWLYNEYTDCTLSVGRSYSEGVAISPHMLMPRK